MSTNTADTTKPTADSVGSVLEYANFEVQEVWSDMPEGSYTKE